MVLHRPAYLSAAEHVQNHRQVEKAVVLCWQLRDIGDLEVIWSGCGKAALDEVGCRGGGGIAAGRAHMHRPPTMAAHQTGLARSTSACAARQQSVKESCG